MTNTLYDAQSNEKDPHAGLGVLLAPLFTWRGRDVYPWFGAEDGDGDGDGSDGEPDDDEDTTGGDGTSDDSAGTVTRSEFDQLRKQLSAADKRREDAEKRLKAIDDANKDELTKATERAEELEKANSKLAEETAGLRLQNAFLMADTGITWHDPADALALAERQGYLEGVVGDDGKVDQGQLKTKLKELAKAKPHLVKDPGNSKDDSSKEKDKPKTPTGQKVGSKVGNGGTKDELSDRYAKYLR